MLLLSQIINGIQIGSIYALVALGYSLVYGIVKLINFAHGEIIMVGSYLTFVMISRSGISPYIAVPLTIFLCAALGMGIEKLAYKPLRNAARISLLITAIGISLLLQNLVQLIMTPNPLMFRNLFPGQINIGGLNVSRVTFVTIIVSVIVMILLSILINKTRIGKAMRATSEDNEAAKLMGININNTISFTFAIGSGLAAIAAVLYSSSYLQLFPAMGSMLGLKAFVAAVLGGIGSIPGAVIGGLLIGIVETFTKAYISSTLADAIVFSILIVVLLVKPTGIMGKNINEKV